MEGFGFNIMDPVEGFAHFLRNASGEQLALYTAMIDREILRRAHFFNGGFQGGFSSQTTLEKVKAKPTGPLQPAPRILDTDEDGFHHMRVCSSAECDDEWCQFKFEPAKFPKNWLPNFCSQDKKTGKMTKGTRLIAYGVDPNEHWEASRDEILSFLKDVRTASISIREGNEFAFITCFSHEDAVKTKKILTVEGDYTVKFVCSNMPLKK